MLGFVFKRQKNCPAILEKLQDIIMRTSLVLDDELINEAVNLTGISNKRELIYLALKELIQNRQKKDLFQLAGQIELEKNYDYKAARSMRHDFD
jgi:Arc/MetJ family transcription regulator